jgi:hypothetical protein
MAPFLISVSWWELGRRTEADDAITTADETSTAGAQVCPPREAMSPLFVRLLRKLVSH